MSIAYKHKKKVRQNLQHPRLRKIRYEFRTLLKLWYHDILDNYLEKITKIGMDKTLSYEKRHKKANKLRRAKEKFVEERIKFPIGCSVCAERKKNLVYLPNRVQWLCVECYDASHKKHPEAYP